MPSNNQGVNRSVVFLIKWTIGNGYNIGKWFGKVMFMVNATGLVKILENLRRQLRTWLVLKYTPSYIFDY